MQSSALPGADYILREGILFKRGKGGPLHRKTWKCRYFILRYGQIEYYSEQGGELKGTLDLRGCDHNSVEILPREVQRKSSGSSQISSASKFQVVSNDRSRNKNESRRDSLASTSNTSRAFHNQSMAVSANANTNTLGRTIPSTAFDSSSASHSAGTAVNATITSSSSSATPLQWRFAVKTEQRRLLLAAHSDLDMFQWARDIRRAFSDSEYRIAMIDEDFDSDRSFKL